MTFDLSQFENPPKRIKKSRYVQPDDISETLLGVTGGLIARTTSILVWRQPTAPKNMVKIAFAGTLLHPIDPTGGDEEYQMWRGSIYFLPTLKFRKGFLGWKVNDALSEGFADPSQWAQLILDNTGRRK